MCEARDILSEEIFQIDTTLSSSSVNLNTAEALKRAHELAEKLQFDDAAKILRDVLSVDNSDPAVMYELATILGWDGKYDESIALYRSLLKLQPENTGLHLEIGRVFLWQADRTGNDKYRRAAIKEFESQIQRNPADCFALKQIGAANLKLGQTEAASSALASAIKLCPNDYEAERLLAETYAAKKEFTKAVELLRRLTDRIPQNPDLRWQLGDFLIQTGDIDSAEKEFQTVLRKYPYHAGALIGLARVHQWKGQLSQSAGYFQSATLWTSMKNPAPFLGLGDVESIREHWSAAKEYYKRALTIDPKNEDAKLKLRQAQWMVGPRLNFEYSNYQASQGLNSAMIGGEAKINIYENGSLTFRYDKYQYSEEQTPDLIRDDYYLSWSQHITGWLKAELGFTLSEFPVNPGESRKLYGWTADVIVTPVPTTTLYLSYNRIPVSESYATISPNYYSDILSTGIDSKFSQQFSLQLNGSLARQHGSFAAGYRNSYYSRWVDLAIIPDLSERIRTEGQFSFQVSDNPTIYIRAGASILKSVRAEHVPYWAPKSFPQEQIILNFSKVIDRVSIDLESRGTHVHEGSEWGYGASASLTLLFGNIIKIGGSASVQQVGTIVPWNGTRYDATFKLCYDD